MKNFAKGLIFSFALSLGLSLTPAISVSADEGNLSVSNPTGDLPKLEVPEEVEIMVTEDESENSFSFSVAPSTFNAKPNIYDYYYYNQLKKDDKLCYQALYEASKANIEPMPEDSALTRDNMNKYGRLIYSGNSTLSYSYISFLRALEYDHPEELESTLFLPRIASFYSSSGQETKYDYYLYYTVVRYTRAEVTTMENELKTARDQIYAEANPTGDEFSKELALHDALLEHVEYDYNVSNNNLSHHYGHTAYGALVKGACVCDGYAKAFKLLLQKAGIEAYVVAGLGNGGGHAWNVVNIDADLYEVDATWNDTEKYQEHPYYYFLTHDYFNCTTDDFNSHYRAIPGFQARTTTHVTDKDYLGYLNAPVAQGTEKSYVNAKKVYQITFDKVNEDAYYYVPYKPVMTYEGKVVTMPTYMRLSGFNFDNWYTKSEGGTVVDENTVFDGPATVYAHWNQGNTSTPFTVYLKSVTGNSSIKVTSGGKYEGLPENLSRTGYEFGGWYLDLERITANSTVLYTSTHELNAKWTPISSTVSFDANDGSGIIYSGIVSYDEKYSTILSNVADPERDGYSFDGWYTKADAGSVVTAKTKITATADHTLYAHWTKIPDPEPEPEPEPEPQPDPDPQPNPDPQPQPDPQPDPDPQPEPQPQPQPAPEDNHEQADNQSSSEGNNQALQENSQQDNNTTELPPEGKLTVGDNDFRLSEDGTAKVTKGNNKKAKSVTIGEVSYEGASFTVTEIQKNAYKKYKNLKTVKIGAGITKIGTGAFSGCENLKKIIINGNDLKSVGSKSFKGISSKAKITIICKDKKTYDKVVKMMKRAGAKKATYKFKKG